MEEQDEPIFSEEDSSSEVAVSSAMSETWRILIVDDDKDVHTTTMLALSGVRIQGRPLQFLHAYTALEAQGILRDESDIAVILLDVVMEGMDAGLKLVVYLRNTLKLFDVRIVLRTGQPGYTPEMVAIRDYDINDYRAKSELTQTKLFTIITVAVRSYEQIMAGKATEVIKASERQTRYMLESSPVAVQVMRIDDGRLVFSNQSAAELFNSPLTEMLGGDPSVFYQDRHDFEYIFQKLCDQEDVLNRSFGMRRSDGGDIWVLASYIHINYDGTPCILSWTIDTTAAKLAADRLRESEELYREQSITDDLTGLYNVRHFRQQIEAEVQRSQRYERPLSLLFFDVDNFKNYNDTYGHLAGDQVLMRLGEVVMDCLRATDGGYRYGGEEFVVMLPETSLSGASIIAERLRQSFERQIFSPTPSIRVNCTVSIGVVERHEGESAVIFISRADAAVYEAKYSGKNCIVAKA